MAQTISKYQTRINVNIPMAIKRLKNVQIENSDFRKIFEIYDTSDTLFYADPPYEHNTRTSKYGYKHEMSLQDHEELTKILLKVKGKVILSGYDTPVYDVLVNAGWKKVYLGRYVKHSVKSEKVRNKYGEEFVWLNFDPSKDKHSTIF